jgi:hypothetical protein
MGVSQASLRPERVATGRLGRLTRSLESVETHQRELQRRRAELLADLALARAEFEAARDARKAAS